MYTDEYSETIVKKLRKIKRKDSMLYDSIEKKMDYILQNPDHSFKLLHHNMKGVMRIHINPFVLVFTINHTTKTISFEDFDHHDKIYR